MNKIIAIDGPAASGKGTLARRLADTLGYAYLDTGSLYRAAAFEVLEAGGSPDNEHDALTGVQTLQAKLRAVISSDSILHSAIHGDVKGQSEDAAEVDTEDRFGAGARIEEIETEIKADTVHHSSSFIQPATHAPQPFSAPHVTLCKSQSVSEILSNPAFREERVGDAASKVAAVIAVREMLIALQRDFAQNPGEHDGAPYKGAILDGRDIGSVICPDADVKLYITASDKIRAGRRTKELQSKGIGATYDAVLRDMRVRDERDSKRQAAPLTRAKDAIVLDTSDLSPDEAFEKALKIVRGRL